MLAKALKDMTREDLILHRMCHTFKKPAEKLKKILDQDDTMYINIVEH